MVSPRIHRTNQHSDTFYRTKEGGDQRTYVHGFFDAIDIDKNLHRPFTWLLMQVCHVLYNASAYLGSWEIERGKFLLWVRLIDLELPAKGFGVEVLGLLPVSIVDPMLKERAIDTHHEQHLLPGSGPSRSHHCGVVQA